MTPPRPDREDHLAGQPLDLADELALSLVRRHLDAADPVPAGLAERSKFAMTGAALEADVARIVRDPAGAGAVRSTEYDRASTVTFESELVSIMVTLEPTGRDLTTIRGWVTAPGAEVELRERSRSSRTTADDEGRFTFSRVERGTVHLLVRPDGGPGTRPVITPGIEV